VLSVACCKRQWFHYHLKRNSDKSLLKWQIASLACGLVCLMFGASVWKADISEIACQFVSRASYFFYLASLSILYFFYEARLTIVKGGSKRNLQEQFLLGLTVVFPILAILSAIFTKGEFSQIDGKMYCHADTEMFVYIAEAVFNVLLNIGFLYFFIHPIRMMQLTLESFSTVSTVEKAGDYSEVVSKSVRVSLVSTLVIVGMTVLQGVLLTVFASHDQNGFVLMAARGVTVMTFCSCMFILTFSIWKKNKKTVGGRKVTDGSSAEASQMKRISSAGRRASVNNSVSGPAGSAKPQEIVVPIPDSGKDEVAVIGTAASPSQS
jgi:hypothetical protein